MINYIKLLIVCIKKPSFIKTNIFMGFFLSVVSVVSVVMSMMLVNVSVVLASDTSLKSNIIVEDVVNNVQLIKKSVQKDNKYVTQLYKYFHENPELSLEEKKSSARIASELSKLGFKVKQNIGKKWVEKKVHSSFAKAPKDVGGYGVVAYLKNGRGPTIMVRADMDALPLQEKTNKSYLSKVMTLDHLGNKVPVMHACGHDVHMASLVGVARQMVDMKDKWSGTLVLIAQPAEELGYGAQAMISDGLFTEFPRPDYNIALHVTGSMPTGKVAYTSGFALANVDMVDIKIKGIGTHGAAPHLGKDPVLLGSQIVVALQTLVARDIDPIESGVVTVGAFHSGFKHNIISDEAHLKITVRSYKDGVRKKLLDGIKRIAFAQAKSIGLPDELMPEVFVDKDYTPATYNDPKLVSSLVEVFKLQFGEDNVINAPPIMGGEDFGFYGRTKEDIPSFIFFIGGTDPKVFAQYKAKGKNAPSNHSPFFAPLAEPTLQTGVEVFTASLFALMPVSPVRSDPVRSSLVSPVSPVRSDPARSDPARSSLVSPVSPVRSDPARSDPARSSPARSSPAR